MLEQNIEILHQILETDGSKLPNTDRRLFSLLKADYRAYMNETALDIIGVQPLRRMVQEAKFSVLSPSLHHQLFSRDSSLTTAYLFALEFRIPIFFDLAIVVRLYCILQSFR